MLAHDVDIFGLSETGADWKQGYPWNPCNQILRDFWPHLRLIGSTSDISLRKQSSNMEAPAPSSQISGPAASNLQDQTLRASDDGATFNSTERMVAVSLS